MKRIAGFLAHSHTGHSTETMVDFPVRGGTLMMSLLMRPSVTAWRCRQIASRCQFQTRGVAGSTRCHAAFTKSLSLRLSFSASNAVVDGSKSKSNIVQEFKLLLIALLEIKQRLVLWGWIAIANLGP